RCFWRSSARAAAFPPRSPARSWAGSARHMARPAFSRTGRFCRPCSSRSSAASICTTGPAAGIPSRGCLAVRQSEMLLDPLKFPIVQLSLDLISLDEALETASIGVAAGVDWLEAGTPLLLAEGLRAVEALRARFPEHPIVADLKTMDGGYLEAEMMAKAGADLVVVMGRAHEATIRRV